MKSIKNEASVCCPNHCEEFDVEYWSFIDAAQDESLKTAVLGGELNLVQCPTCGSLFHHDGDLIYLEAPKQLLIFIFSEKNRAQEKQLREKMQHDYDIIKNTLAKQLHIDYPPVCVFGLEALKNLLQEEEKYSFESEAIAASSAAQGFSVVRLAPAYAREHHFPYYVPAPQQTTPHAYAVAASRVLKGGLNSPLLTHFKDQMSQEGAKAPCVI